MYEQTKHTRIFINACIHSSYYWQLYSLDTKHGIVLN